MYSAEENQQAWALATGANGVAQCQCGAAKVYAKEPNLEYLHQDYCPLYLSPNWINELNKELKDEWK